MFRVYQRNKSTKHAKVQGVPMKNSKYSLILLSSLISIFAAWPLSIRAQDAAIESQSDASPAVYVRLDGGAVWQQFNDVAIPGKEGTKFDLSKLEKGSALPFYRLEGRYDFAQNHRIRLLYAPLQLDVKGELGEEVSFNGKTFQAKKETSASYKFSSYRLSWAYRVAHDAQAAWHIGFTGKIRDAKIALEQSGTQSSYTNLGFVPLVHVAYQRRLGEDWHFFADLDAAAAPQGRAEDLGLLLMYELKPNWQLGGGIRTLEGGADNDKVYTFSWLHYAFLSLAYHS